MNMPAPGFYAPAADRYAHMPYVRCGRSGLKLPRVSLGLWNNFGSVTPQDTARDMLLTAFDAGVTYFDLANNYGPRPGAAEETLGKIMDSDLRPHRDELILATKAGYTMQDGPYGDGGSRKYLMSSLDASLRRMKVDYVDIFYHHRFDPDTPLEETMRTLADIVHQGKALENADRPFVAVLGGAKIEDKLNVINNLLEKVDTLIIGGGMAFTFLKAKGYEIGKSLLDETKIDYCKDMMAKAAEKGVQLLLPVDTVCIKDFPNPIDAPVDTVTVDADAIPADMEGCDIGPKSRELFAAAVKSAKTVVWNGPMGVFENPTLAAGTLAVAQAMADSDAVTIIGGGDSAAAVEQMGLGDKMTHISTGGGASLEYLEGKTLPGVACLDEK